MTPLSVPAFLLAGAFALAALLPTAPARSMEGVVVAIIDSGIDPHHRAFESGQVVAWRDFLHGAPTPYDDHGHGTAVASRAAGHGFGASPGAKLAVAKVLDEDAILPSFAVLREAIRWAVEDAGARVVSVSIGNHVFLQVAPGDESGVNAAIAEATERGALVVWSAGNQGWWVTLSPVGANAYGYDPSFLQGYGTSSPHALVVGASNAGGARWEGSRIPAEVLAWGAGVPVALPGNATGSWYGTSFAAPYVAGAAARVLAAAPSLAPSEVERILLATARDAPGNPYALEGYGLVEEPSIRRAEAVARGEAEMPDRAIDDAQHDAIVAFQRLYGE